MRPGWVLAPDYSPQDGAALVTMTYGATKVPVGDPHHNPVPRLGRHAFSPYAFQHTLFCDFKAVNRYLRHHTLGAQRRWIARFVRARDIWAIEDLLSAGGEPAQRGLDGAAVVAVLRPGPQTGELVHFKAMSPGRRG